METEVEVAVEVVEEGDDADRADSSEEDEDDRDVDVEGTEEDVDEDDKAELKEERMLSKGRNSAMREITERAGPEVDR